MAKKSLPKSAHPRIVAMVLSLTTVAATFFGCDGPGSNSRFLPRRERANRMERVLKALADYNDVSQLLPAAKRWHLPAPTCRDVRGRALYSWRFLLLSFCEMPSTKMDLSAPWYAPANCDTASRPAAYYCFSRDPNGRKEVTTNLVAVTGPNAAFDPDGKAKWDELPYDLIVIIESGSVNVHWAEPGDLEVRQVDQSVAAGLDGEGVLVGFADGQVWFLRNDVPLQDLLAFMTIPGAKESDRGERLAPYHVRVK